MNAPHFFLTKEGNALKERSVGQTFERLLRGFAEWLVLSAMMGHVISLGYMI